MPPITYLCSFCVVLYLYPNFETEFFLLKLQIRLHTIVTFKMPPESHKASGWIRNVVPIAIGKLILDTK